MIKHHALLVLALLICGCKTKPRTPGQGSADTATNQAMLTKLAGYVECLDTHAARVFQIADGYTGRLAGQPPTPETDLFLPVSADPKDCLETIADARALPPALPELEAAGDAFGKALSDVFVLTTAAHRYFDRANPATYDLAKAREAHPKLVAAFAAFDAAQGALFDQVHQLNHTIHVDQLARREQRDGRTLPVIADSLMVAAEDVVAFGSIRWDHLEVLDLATMTLRLARYENALEELALFPLAPNEEPERVHGVAHLVDNARAFLIASKQLAGRARDHIAYTDAERLRINAGNEASVPGTPAAMIKSYNRLVDDYIQW